MGRSKSKANSLGSLDVKEANIMLLESQVLKTVDQQTSSVKQSEKINTRALRLAFFSQLIERFRRPCFSFGDEYN